jgi:hypothetical protein
VFLFIACNYHLLIGYYSFPSGLMMSLFTACMYHLLAGYYSFLSGLVMVKMNVTAVCLSLFLGLRNCIARSSFVVSFFMCLLVHGISYFAYPTVPLLTVVLRLPCVLPGILACTMKVFTSLGAG